MSVEYGARETPICEKVMTESIRSSAESEKAANTSSSASANSIVFKRQTRARDTGCASRMENVPQFSS